MVVTLCCNVCLGKLDYDVDSLSSIDGVECPKCRETVPLVSAIAFLLYSSPPLESEAAVQLWRVAMAYDEYEEARLNRD